MKLGLLTIPVILVLAGGLALRGASDVAGDWVDTIERHTAAVRDRAFEFAGSFSGQTSNAEPQPAAPGPTYSLVVSERSTVGLDRTGLVTIHDTVCDAFGVPVLTGCPAVLTEPGEMVSSPEVILGLSIIKAFEEAPFLMDMLSEVNLADLEHPKVILSGGIVVELGQGRYRNKIVRLNQVLMQASRLSMQPEYIDLRFGRQVIVNCDNPQHVFDKEV
jgi:hypothetical protein